MIRTHFGRLLVGGVAALLVVAGIDALRSTLSEDAPSAPTNPTATVPPSLVSAAPACTREQMAVSIEVRHASKTAPQGLDVLPRRRVVTTIVVRRVGTEPCTQDPLPFALNIYDRKGRGVGDWLSTLYFAGAFAPGTESTVSLPDVYDCDRPGPFHAIASVGPYTARRDHLSYSAITCWKGRRTAHA
jgi:hypothetical protein